MNSTALLALEDGTFFWGKSIGANSCQTGEIVFNTSMTGYQEILTDPSYTQQMVTLTYPHIGNTGINEEDIESDSVYANGLIIRDSSLIASNWRTKGTLSEYLVKYDIPGIAEIDTRKLTRILREKGAMRACLMCGEGVSEAAALAAAKASERLENCDLAQKVTTKKPYYWRQSIWSLGLGYAEKNNTKYKVVVCDYGVKHNILRILASQDCEIIVVPAKTSAEEVLAYKPDGVFLSNGPGDPKACTYAIEAIQLFLEKQIPLFGICLGHQLLALACGAKTKKMKFGHHGANHPVQDLSTLQVLITSQNHGFCVEEDNVPEQLEVTHRSLFDNTIQGIRRKDVPAFSFQGHPEASPGPQDVMPLFEKFIQLMHTHRQLTR